MNNRQIELIAAGNDRRYRVTLIINGRKFDCFGEYDESVLGAYSQIANRVELVYGKNLYEDADNADIVDALVGAEDIIRSFHNGFRKG